MATSDFNNLSILTRAAEMSDRSEAVAMIRLALNLQPTDHAENELSWQAKWERLSPWSRMTEIANWLRAECLGAIKTVDAATLSPDMRERLNPTRGGARRTFD